MRKMARMRVQRVVAVFCVLAMVCAMFAGCGKSAGNTNSADTNSTNVNSADKSNDKVNIVLWHSMSGNLSETLEKLTKMFNESQNQITIEAQYQGTYEECINKLKSSMRTKSGPDLIQIGEGGTGFMINSGFIKPMQVIIDTYGIDISSLEENILNYYTVDGKLNSMPFNTSVPLLYYNKGLLAELGYPDGPADWKELKEIALKVVDKKDANIPYGFVLASNMWIFEQPLVQMGVPTVDNNNGRDAIATNCLLDESDKPLEVLKALKDLRDSGAWADLGFDSANTAAAFTSGMGAMYIDSSGALKTFINTIDGKFELGTCAFPSVNKEESNGGITLGGASLYALNNERDKEIDDAIAEFVKFLIEPETQAFWSSNTGYIPVTTKALEEDSMKKTLEDYPQFQTAIDQLHASPNMGYGAIYGSFLEGRNVCKSYLEKMLMGDITPEESIDGMAKDIDKLISDYNEAN